MHLEDTNATFCNRKLFEQMEKKFLSSKETAELLDISIHQLYKLSSKGEIATYSPTGGKIYFLRDEIEDWILSSKTSSSKQINKRAINYSFIKKNKL